MPTEATPQFQNSVDVKLDYIQRDIRAMAVDIKDIKTDFISRREFVEAIKDLEKDITFLQKIVYGAVALMCIAVLGGIFKLVIR